MSTRTRRRRNDDEFVRTRFRAAMPYADWVRRGHPNDATVTCPECHQNHFASAHLHPVRGPMRSCVTCRAVFAHRRSSSRTRSRTG